MILVRLTPPAKPMGALTCSAEFVSKVVSSSSYSIIHHCFVYFLHSFMASLCFVYVRAIHYVDYVEQNIRSGSLNVKCLISECNKNMSCSRFLDDVSLDCKNSFNAALAENYTLSKSKNAVQNPIASLKGCTITSLF